MKMFKQWIPFFHALGKYSLITIVCLNLYTVCGEIAYIQRGYISHGGEYFILFLPLAVWLGNVFKPPSKTKGGSS